MTDTIDTQKAEFDACERLSVAYRALTMTGIVDDDYPEVRHRYERALTSFLDAVAANGHRRLPEASVSDAGGAKTKGLTLSALRSANLARQQEWDGSGKLGLIFRSNELAGEVGEACNQAKKLERERLGIRGSRTTKERLGEELGDVVICASLTAIAAGIDLEAATVKKFNKTSEEQKLKTRLGE